MNKLTKAFYDKKGSVSSQSSKTLKIKGIMHIIEEIKAVGANNQKVCKFS